MKKQSRSSTDEDGEERPDNLYGLVAGVYVAALLAPAVVLLAAQVTDDSAMLYGALIGSVSAITGLTTWTVSRRSEIAVILGETDTVWLLVLLPFGWFVGAFGADGMGRELPAIAVPLAVFATAGGVFLAIAIVTMSRNRHADAVLDGTTELAAWEARLPRRWRRLAGGITIGSFVVSAAGVVAAIAFDAEWGWSLYYVLFVGIPLVNVRNSRTFRVTEAGLVVEQSLQRQLRPWSAFDDYELTDSTLTIRQTSWWRPAYHSDRSDIESVDAVVDALDTLLPERR